MSYQEEFRTVDAVIEVDTETSGVDAFSLTLIKAERQARKLFTFLVFQMPCFSEADIWLMRASLAKSRQSYFGHFLKGWNEIYYRSIRDLVGERYGDLLNRIEQAVTERNKIFHGQLPARYLSRAELLDYVRDIRLWCKTLAASAAKVIGYDGFARNSFRKSQIPGFEDRLRIRFKDIADYEAFIRQELR